jgi:hypothetical protein
MRKSMQNFSQDSRSPARDVNPAPPEYETGVLTTRPRRSVGHTQRKNSCTTCSIKPGSVVQWKMMEVTYRVTWNDCGAIVVTQKWVKRFRDATIFNSEDVDNLLLRNVRMYLWVYAATHSRKKSYLYQRETLKFLLYVDQREICLHELITWNKFHATGFLCV